MNLSQPNYLDIPSFFDASKVAQVYRVAYQQRAVEAEAWAEQYQIQPVAKDRAKIGLLLIDVQNTFCLPDFELFVNGAVEDNIRLCQFIYRNLASISTIIPTLDSHTAMQIFHPVFWVDHQGKHPNPATTISLAEVEQRKWQVNSDLADSLTQGNVEQLASHAQYYLQKLSDDGKYPLTIWPYHAMLGGLGHALVSAVEEAVFFHSIVRKTKTQFELKGDNSLTENYSILSPEVLDTVGGKSIAQKNTSLINQLLNFEAVIIAGQAKSHCVAWTVDNLLTEILQIDPQLTSKIYLLEDCMSPVAIAGIVDFTDQANAAMEKFADAGINLVKSTDPFLQNYR